MLPLIKKHAKVKLINGRFEKHLKTEKMTNLNAELIIAERLFTNMVDKLETKLLDKSYLIREVTYFNKELNSALKKSFDEIVFVLQSVVNSYYQNYYEIDGFIPFNKSNIDYALSHNLSILRNAKKLIKFIN